MPKWEYQTIYISVPPQESYESVDNYLNGEGENGWELVGTPHIHADAEGLAIFCFFKRQVI